MHHRGVAAGGHGKCPHPPRHLRAHSAAVGIRRRRATLATIALLHRVAACKCDQDIDFNSIAAMSTLRSVLSVQRINLPGSMRTSSA